MDHYEENALWEQAADSGRESGAEAEREAIVAWLRDLGLSIELRGVSGAIHIGLADAIESRQHLSGDRER